MYAFKKYFIKAVNKHFPDTGSAMLTEIETRFQEISKDTQLARTSTNPMDKRLDFTAYFLALIQSLENNGQSYEQIKDICLEITDEFMGKVLE